MAIFRNPNRCNEMVRREVHRQGHAAAAEQGYTWKERYLGGVGYLVGDGYDKMFSSNRANWYDYVHPSELRSRYPEYFRNGGMERDPHDERGPRDERGVE